MTNSMITIGVDVGGTRTRVGVVSDGECRVRTIFPTPLVGDAIGFLKLIRGQVFDLLKELKITDKEVDGIGFGIPGVISFPEGKVIQAVNCPVLHETPLGVLASGVFSWPVVVANDADSAAWAEYRLGNHAVRRGLVYITVSTGIGGGIVSGGRLLIGDSTSVAEVGHQVININGPLCRCGRKGCLEAVASGWGLAKGYRRLTGRRLDAVEIYRLASEGDPVARLVTDEASEALVIGIGNLWRVLGLPFVIGGGITLAGPPFWKGFRRRFNAMRRKKGFKGLKFFPAALGTDDRGLLGAALLAGGDWNGVKIIAGS